jgi:hypothetical protein
MSGLVVQACRLAPRTVTGNGVPSPPYKTNPHSNIPFPFVSGANQIITIPTK